MRPVALTLLWAGWTAAWAAAPVPLTLTLPAAGAAHAERPSGFNYGLAMQVALYAAEWEAVGVRALRFPPGNDADNAPLTRDTIDAFKVQWQLLGEPEVWVVANFFEGPEHAAWAARYFEEVGLPVRHWAVGNEPDLYPQNRMDPSWTPEVYCERLAGFASALKAVNPENRLTGPAVSGARPLGEAYLREVLQGCGELLDVLTWHVYPTDGTWEDAAALATSEQVGEEIRRYRAWLKSPEHNPRGYTEETALAVTEFGLSWRTASYRHLEDLTAALWLADVLGQLTREGVTGFYFALQGFGGHGLIDQSGWVRPTYYVYAMLADFRGAALDVSIGAEAPLLTAYAVASGGAAGGAHLEPLEPARLEGVQVLLVNRGTEAVRVALQGVTGALEVNTLDEATFDELHGYRKATQAAGAPIAVPARSVVLVRGEP